MATWDTLLLDIILTVIMQCMVIITFLFVIMIGRYTEAHIEAMLQHMQACRANERADRLERELQDIKSRNLFHGNYPRL